MAKDKKDHKGIASDLVKGLIDKPSTTPLQTSQNNVVTPIVEKVSTDKFTVEITTTLLDEVRLYAVQNKMKLRPLFEAALAEYLKNHKFEAK